MTWIYTQFQRTIYHCRDSLDCLETLDPSQCTVHSDFTRILYICLLSLRTFESRVCVFVFVFLCLLFFLASSRRAPEPDGALRRAGHKTVQMVQKSASFAGNMLQSAACVCSNYTSD